MLEKSATPEEIARLSRQLGLDLPLWRQYIDYLAGLLRWDFGRSWETKQRVAQMILDGLGPSLSLALPAFLVATVVSLTVALVAALYKDRWPDRLLVTLSVAGMSLSVLAFIIGAQYLFAFKAGWFPISGWEPGLSGVPFLALPVAIWVAASVGSAVRFYRAVFLEEMRKEYVITARRCGDRGSATVVRQAAAQRARFRRASWSFSSARRCSSAASSARLRSRRFSSSARCASSPRRSPCCA
jgi:peptide/nickel transport system permease protein